MPAFADAGRPSSVSPIAYRSLPVREEPAVGPRRWALPVAGILAAAAPGVALAAYPLPTAALTILACTMVFGVVLRRYVPRLFLGALGLVLLGYALLGRGFAYIGVAPLYVGEFALAFGLFAALLSG